MIETIPRLILVGGFLGAGKTTLLAQAAMQLSKQGKRVGLVANDQAANLVDSEVLKAAGTCVEEVAGGCFCCRFPDMIAALDALGGERGGGRAPGQARGQLHRSGRHGHAAAEEVFMQHNSTWPLYRCWSTAGRSACWPA